MNRLPLPNWTCPPNMNPMAHFIPMSNVGYGTLPFLGQPYHYPPRNHPPPQPIGGYHSAIFVPRHPIHRDFKQSNMMSNRTNNNSNCQSQAPTCIAQDFSCDVCEKSFQTQKILETHLQSHVECDHEGCSFTASRKMLKLHFIQNHAKGKMRIKLDTPEEIAKWKEQRRKKYPTVANVQKKLAEQKARRENGQMAETQTFRYRGNKHRHQKRQQHSRYQKQNGKCDMNVQAKESQPSQLTVKKDEMKLESDVDPLSILLDTGDDEEVAGTQSATPPQSSAPACTSALMSLCSYGGESSSDENDLEIEVNNCNLSTSHPVVHKASSITEVNNNELKTKIIQELYKQEQLSSPKTEKPSQHKRTSRKRKQDFKKNKGPQIKKKVTLLEKLLAPEMRHESNVILQCIRYIINNNYLDGDWQNKA